MKVRTETHFDSAHFVENYDGACSRLHGHRWRVEVEVQGPINPETDMVVDFKQIKDTVEKFDHHKINDKVDFNPTAERLCKYFFKELTEKFSSGLGWRVRVFESPDSWAESSSKEMRDAST